MSDPRPAPLRALRRMTGRDPHERGRTASTLELFFDLVFVVAVSLSSQALHHLYADGHAAQGALGYLMVFFAIWWAWMNFTWFAASFDTDDWLYRIMTILQMAGVLVLAAGAGPAMEHYDFTLVTIGYVVMRLALVGQWVRAAISDQSLRGTALRYAIGIVIVQILWLARLTLPPVAGFIGFFVLVIAEIAVPVFAERHRATPWNPHHITERYGLFTLILLGESILASTNAVLEAAEAGDHIPELLSISAFGLITAAGMWWVYFARTHRHHTSALGTSLLFGYFHYVIFAAAGAFSAGIEVEIDVASGHSALTPIAAAATFTVPVALYLLSVWWLTTRHTLTRIGNALYLLGVLTVLAGTISGNLSTTALTAVGLVLAAIATEVGEREQAAN
ncbi:Bacterial low temperature requirement A protein (LtrA) [Microbacterium ginsengisoli]|jgi:low temperature requirement protein LtrA|uniref:Bacterial low temperature requirement A protein (LtrA) n=2 Tax=Microbacterium ginsengisoli TaxID=400772 RepID=A0A0F0M0R9_9MICO|nr:low temperature requirement protein A [Microbacterium ginsengisoli]KJL37221.1 Bacterial low temperature requirement A protein (LtrA) [Microbacterium ginsengisoli]